MNNKLHNEQRKVFQLERMIISLLAADIPGIEIKRLVMNFDIKK